ncbi:hypothetical protein PGT21_000158 [Puccinia graminis f. sp. tritici]|uniref:Uncharacterized protein n=1 Tax=Puccinia graminis f. sp. tritici TaxID=56615 RepID=A0A5B0Q144_PUCGR|nr:hypothetical protein PGT21_000158 [Puccinia graminis f. sp. tritici]
MIPKGHPGLPVKRRVYGNHIQVRCMVILIVFSQELVFELVVPLWQRCTAGAADEANPPRWLYKNGMCVEAPIRMIPFGGW